MLNHAKNRTFKKSLVAYGFLLPFFLVYSVFIIWPVIQGIYVSLYEWGLMGKRDFEGLGNYQKFLGDTHFWGALQNTAFFVLISAPVIIVLALVLALLANRSSGTKKFLRTSYYLPSVLSVSIISFLNLYMFSPYVGLVNGILHALGILQPGQEIIWLDRAGLAWVVIVLATSWWTVGFSMLLFISALQDIPTQLYEAAEIDGASPARQLFGITLPLLGRTTRLVIMLQIIAAFKVFGQIFMITRGGPGAATRPLIQYIYQTAFTDNDLGYAASMSYVLFFILVVLTLIQLAIENKRGEGI